MKYDTLLKLLGALRVRELPDNSKRKFVSRKLSTASVDFVLLQCLKQQIIPIYKTAINIQINVTLVLI